MITNGTECSSSLYQQNIVKVMEGRKAIEEDESDAVAVTTKHMLLITCEM